jgi:predicted nucleic acid-binding protein
MAARPSLVCWDACAWIALIQQEKIRDANSVITEDRERLCKTVMTAAEKGQLIVVTSALSLAEVCKEIQVIGKIHTLDDYFEHTWVEPVNVDRDVGYLARELMGGGHAGLKPADAIHVSTALLSNVSALHTFDKKLLALDNLLDIPNGGKLRICKPAIPGKEPPLLAEIKKKGGK